MSIARSQPAYEASASWLRPPHLRTLQRLSILFLLAFSFAWGFFAHREKVFPFHSLQRFARSLGWVKNSHDVELLARSSDGLAPLLSIPYSGGGWRKEEAIAFANPAKMSPGYTLLTYGGPRRTVAELLDVSGQIVHRWKLRGLDMIQLAIVLPEGDLIAVDQGRALVRLDPRGEVRWRVDGMFHHSLELRRTASGDRLFTLRSRPRQHPRIHDEAKIVDEEIVELDEHGREIRTISVLDGLIGSPYEFLLPAPTTEELAERAPDRKIVELELDLLHANHAQPLAGTALAPSFGDDTFLVSIRNLNLFVAISPERGAVWGWGPGRLILPHHPTVLANGHLLVFNNGRLRSEVLEIEPTTGRAIWRYRADDFFTPYAGSSQRLPNGNTLITESAPGRVFEVTPSGEIVWTWLNPTRLPDGGRGAIYRAHRYTRDELPFLSELSPKS